MAMAQGTDWSRLESVAAARYGDAGTDSVTAWRDLLSQASRKDTLEQLVAVNDFFNSRVQWTTDSLLFGQSDYWATPLETLALSAGDCEDFSIAKYVTLLELGVPASSLRLVYVKANRSGLAPQAHMVLAWYKTPGDAPMILDNINPTLLSAEQRKDLKPVFSFNHMDLWLGTGLQRSGADPRARMARWQQVLNRTQAEGMTIK
jgi:predicted transglutaminase-like cysteine proteinase